MQARAGILGGGRAGMGSPGAAGGRLRAASLIAAPCVIGAPPLREGRAGDRAAMGYKNKYILARAVGPNTGERARIGY